MNFNLKKWGRGLVGAKRVEVAEGVADSERVRARRVMMISESSQISKLRCGFLMTLILSTICLSVLIIEMIFTLFMIVKVMPSRYVDFRFFRGRGIFISALFVKQSLKSLCLVPGCVYRKGITLLNSNMSFNSPDELVVNIGPHRFTISVEDLLLC